MKFALSAAMTVLALGAWAHSPVVSVDYLSDNAVRITTVRDGQQAPMPTSLLLPNSDVKVTTTQVSTGMQFVSSTGLIVDVHCSNGAVTVSRGSTILATDDGMRTLTDSTQTLTVNVPVAKNWYGAGERGYSLDLSNDTLPMYNKQNYGYVEGETRIKQMNITMPLVASGDGVAVIFDDFAAAELRIVGTTQLVYTTESPAAVSYVVVAPEEATLKGLTAALTLLTGRQSIAPLWSLGYITSKYGYKTEEETRGVIDRLTKEGYPVDGVVLDLYWYGKEQDMGRLAWDPYQWPTHKAMLADLKKQGVNTVIISQPYVLTNGRGVDNYNELKDKGVFVRNRNGQPVQEVQIWVGEGGMFDVSSPAARQWLRERYKQLTDEGVGGWWGDLGEPEVHPFSSLHANGLTGREYHNKYGNDWSSIIYDLYQEEYPDTRLMTLMRGGTIGLQRYSVFPWSTDVSRSWGGLQPQVRIMLGAGLSGLGYMSHDVGGFAIDHDNPYEPELYVRWLQLGTFSPVLRTHAQDTAEPYLYPDQQSIILPLIKARYQWLPYNYTLAWENASQGTPLVRPINFHSGDTSGQLPDDEYLWGADVLVAPVMQKGAVNRTIVMPNDEGSVWLDMLNPSDQYTAGQVVENYPAPLEVLPMFVRGGAFITKAGYEMDNTVDYRTDAYTIDYYPVEGVTGESVVYEDDLKSAKSVYMGNYALMTLRGSDSPAVIKIEASLTGSYHGMKTSKGLTFNIHSVVPPRALAIDGKEVSSKAWTWDNGTLTVKAHWPDTAKPLSIVIMK